MGTVTVMRADAAKLPLADASVDLCLFSPPYCDARCYGINAKRKCAEWVEWMLIVVAEAQRVSRGAVIVVAAGVTRERNYWPACEGLMWEWWKRGGDCQLYRPCYWFRHGIPGSGGTDWFRADVEYCMCFKRPGELPYSANTAMGHPPKWAPGGEFSHRLSDGKRVNQWGPVGSRKGGGHRFSHGKETEGGGPRPSHVVATVKEHTKRDADGTMRTQKYTPPVLANPGVAIEAVWSEEDETFWLDIPVGGGQLGDKRAHENEAPFPERIAEFFIRSLTREGDTVLDQFSGSGTTAKVAKALNRNAVACDIRESQVELTKRRTSRVQRELLIG